MNDDLPINVDDYLDPEPVATPGPNDIVFTQYLRPNGRTRTIWIERSPEVVAMAKTLTEAGYRFEAEELTTGHVSLTVERPTDPDDEGPIAHELGMNGPGVPAMVDTLIRDAFEKTQKLN